MVSRKNNGKYDVKIQFWTWSKKRKWGLENHLHKSGSAGVHKLFGFLDLLSQEAISKGHRWDHSSNLECETATVC